MNPAAHAGAGRPPFAPSEYRRRLDAVRTAMDADGHDCLVAFGNCEWPGAIIYLTGYEPVLEHAWCVVTATECKLVLPPLEWRATNGTAALDPGSVLRAPVPVERVLALLGECTSVALAAHAATPAPYAEALLAAGPAGARVPSSLLDGVRARKSEAEIELLREAARIGDAAASAFATGVREGGLTEVELVGRLEQAMRLAGLERLWFPIVLGAGANSLEVVPQPRARAIAPGEMVFVDCFLRQHGYCSDLARATVAGEPTAAQRRLLDTVELMYREAVAAVRPGADARAPHRAAKAVAADAGYEYFHDTGHGIGADLHEPPPIDEVPGEVAFEEGMVVTVEPGLYVEGTGGARLENTLLVSSTGATALQRSPTALW